MWAQLISMRIKPGAEEKLQSLFEILRSTEQPDSGLVSQLAMVDENDPSRFLMLAVFESEEKARERENDPRRAEGLKVLREVMAEIIDGPREFTDLNVISDATH